MTVRRRIALLLTLGAIAACGSTVALIAGAQAKSSCGHSSAQSTYGGQGQQIAQVGCNPATGSALPFTGFDLALVLAAGGILVAAGFAVRWWLQHGGE